MDLKALIFARDYRIYLNFISEYHLNGSECKYAQKLLDIQGCHKDVNPDLLLIFLEGYWLTPAGRGDEIVNIINEFEGRVYFGAWTEVAARLIQLTYITKQEQLPEYLSHENEEVRKAALKRQEELNDLP
jgi:hypothetical protein